MDMSNSISRGWPIGRAWISLVHKRTNLIPSLEEDQWEELDMYNSISRGWPIGRSWMNLAHKWTYLIPSLGDDQWEELELVWLKSTISTANKCIQFMFFHQSCYTLKKLHRIVCDRCMSMITCRHIPHILGVHICLRLRELDSRISIYWRLIFVSGDPKFLRSVCLLS